MFLYHDRKLNNKVFIIIRIIDRYLSHVYFLVYTRLKEEPCPSILTVKTNLKHQRSTWRTETLWSILIVWIHQSIWLLLLVDETCAVMFVQL